MIGAPELDAGDPILVALEVGEGGVELRRADRSGLAEVVLRSIDCARAGRNAVLIGVQHRTRRNVQEHRVDGPGADGEVGMGAAAEGARIYFSWSSR